MSPVTERPAPADERVIVVIPCFNEETRLDLEQVGTLISDPRVGVLMVDDGSTDGTLRLLHRIIEQDPDRISTIALGTNRGKAEAVRIGLMQALESGGTLVGYLDADFATSASEFLRLVEVLGESEEIDVVMGSRVAMLGTDIERRPARHYLGRIFATAASLALDVTVYDTQCGAKVFRSSPRLGEALSEPFTVRWAFDVELLRRMTSSDGATAPIPDGRLCEVPLREWRDVDGSKVTLGGAARMLAELGQIWRDRVRAGSTRHDDRI